MLNYFLHQDIMYWVVCVSVCLPFGPRVNSDNVEPISLSPEVCLANTANG